MSIEEAKRFLKIAKTDLEAAKSLHESSPHLDKQIGYHASQCVEKLLKTLIQYEGGDNVKEHNIATLHSKLAESELDSLIESLYDLTDYAVAGRYGELDEEELDLDFEIVIPKIEKLLSQIEAKIAD